MGMKLAGKLGFVGGGRMAEAMIKGILRAELISAGDILVADPDESRRTLLRKQYGVTVHPEAEAVWPACQTVVLAVKPQIMGKLLERSRGQVTGQHLIISIAAGIPLSLIEGTLAGSGCRAIRVMPNTPAIVQESASALSGGGQATPEDLATAKAIFDSFGTSVILDERALDAVTGLSGSGPAYVFSFIEALTDAGVKTGLSRPVAEKLVLQTVLGSVKLAMETGEHPAQLRAMVTSPGGTTIAGLHVMARAGFAGIIMDAVEAAANRSRELGAEQKASGR
ncbi:MAG: pyrroline-5-carboxylate reductase [Desulfobacteraceae bacterium]|nr:pyrroline-5-carboxylate reductase [Desulfobacteraceae bacterium]